MTMCVLNTHRHHFRFARFGASRTVLTQTWIVCVSSIQSKLLHVDCGCRLHFIEHQRQALTGTITTNSQVQT
ncbi:hypothetical protein PM082_003287 [Marasmius tenuissimus]|nr:hypothetical protein PM082_003287 [Marasmius tenuissimus]